MFLGRLSTVVIRMVLPEDIRKWAEENYPQYLHNEELIRKLYERIVLRNKYRVPNVRYPPMKTTEVGFRQRAEVRGVILVDGRYEYEGCSVCYRKRCEVHPEAAVPIKLVLYKGVIGDDAGELRWSIVRPASEEQPFSDGDEVVLRGYAGKDLDGRLNLGVDEYEVVKKVGKGGTGDDVSSTSQPIPEDVDIDEEYGDKFAVGSSGYPSSRWKRKVPADKLERLFSKIRENGGVSRRMFVEILHRMGMNYEDVEEYVVIDGDIVRLKEGEHECR